LLVIDEFILYNISETFFFFFFVFLKTGRTAQRPPLWAAE
jgi:hypothetical protein